MQLIQEQIREALTKSGCLDFFHVDAERVLGELQADCPGTWEIMTPEAAACLKNAFFARYELIYIQSIMQEIRPFIEKEDPVGLMLGKLKPESVEKGARSFLEKTGGPDKIRSYLHKEYPLLKEYEANMYKNFFTAYSGFLNAFNEKKEDIEDKLLDGRRINEISHLSTGGADIHRHGRCVVGLTTDAGRFFYKPHDCGLDELYFELVQRFFPEETKAAGVVSGDGFAFVSCLEKSDVDTKEDVHKYFYNFGVLASLFHGLGSTDMHFENIIACGVKPSAIDIETLLGIIEERDNNSGITLFQSRKDLRESLIRTLILPIRMYKGPIISPLYYNQAGRISLPETEGKAYTVEGYEDDFFKGFSDGYDRILSHREDILKITEAHGSATLRCLLNSTSFYAHLRNSLFMPAYLKSEKERQKIYARLSIPYKKFGREVEKTVVDYEWSCLLHGDIPYFCTALNSRDLCGEDIKESVKPGVYKKSVLESTDYFLSRLSPEEKLFELELLERQFEHAPVDVPADEEKYPVSENVITGSDIYTETAEIFSDIEKDAIRCRDGKLIWFSTVASVKSLTGCGDMALFADIGAFSSNIANAGFDSGLRIRAKSLADLMCRQTTAELSMWESMDEENAKNMWKVLPTGLHMGLGGVLSGFSVMEKNGVRDAGDVIEKLIDIIQEKSLYNFEKTSLAEGNAGLITGLEATGRRDERVLKAVSSCADRLISEEAPKKADLPYGCAGRGIALAAAYKLTGDEKYVKGALESFEKVREMYDPKLSGWPDSEAKVRFLADRGPHSAGIYLAAEYAKAFITNQGGESSASSDISAFSKTLEEIKKLSLESILSEESILRNDSLDQGNALTALALFRSGKKEEAGKILAAVLERKKKKGTYSLTPPGIRSTFDPSLFMGAVGVGCLYLENLDNNKE